MNSNKSTIPLIAFFHHYRSLHLSHCISQHHSMSIMNRLFPKGYKGEKTSYLEIIMVIFILLKNQDQTLAIVILFFYLQIYFNNKIRKIFMRSVLQNTYRHSPCKSHSPDFVNRNSIKNTTIQVQDIRHKLKKADEKQLRLDIQSSISQAPSDLINVQHKYKQLYNEYLRIKNEHKVLSQQNKLLNQQNQRLSLSKQKNQSINQLSNILINQKQYDEIREKMIVAEQQKIRLERQLEIERNRNEQSLRNIQTLRKEKLNLTEYISLELKRSSSSKNIPNFDNEIKQQNMASLWNQLVKGQELKLNRILEDLNRRIIKAEMNQKIIIQKQSRLNHQNSIGPISNRYETHTSYNSNQKYDTNYKHRINSYEKPHILSTGSPFSINIQSISNTDSPINKSIINTSSPVNYQSKFTDSLEKLENENFSLYQNLKIREAEIQKLKIQKEKMMRKVNDLQLQKRNKITTPKFNQMNDKPFSKIQFKIESEPIQSIKSENFHLKAQVQHLSETFNKQKQQFITKIHSLEEKITKIQQKLKKDGFQYGLKDNEIVLLRQQIDQLSKKMQGNDHSWGQKFTNLEQQYNKTKENNSALSSQLKNYMLMLEYIRSKIQINEIKDILDESTTIYSECEKTILEERQVYNQTIYTANNQLLQKQEQIISLQKELALKNKEIELLSQEIINIKRINQELQKNNMNFFKSNKEKIISKSDHIKQNNTMIIDKLRSGQQKLDILYQKINNCINFDGSSLNFN